MIKKLEAIIFDLDGVITDTAKFHYLAWKKLGEDLGITFDKEFNETLKGISRIDSLERILILGNKENDFTKEEKNKLANEKNELYIKLVQNITPCDILPGVKDFLISIKEKNLKIGMASASKNALMVSKLLQVEDYFDYIIDASTVNLSKPNPEVFIKVAKALNVDPIDCIGIEDAAAGIEAIKEANMFAVGVGNSKVLINADVILNSTEELNLNFILEKYLNK